MRQFALTMRVLLATTTKKCLRQHSGAAILTSDRDFYHTIPLLHPSHAGIVVIALRQPSRTLINSRLKWFMENIEGPLDNRVFILRDFSYRTR